MLRREIRLSWAASCRELPIRLPIPMQLTGKMTVKRISLSRDYFEEIKTEVYKNVSPIMRELPIRLPIPMTEKMIMKRNGLLRELQLKFGSDAL